MTRAATVVAVLSAVALLAGCGRSTDDAGSTATPGAVHGEITVFAAASLSESFGELADRFESDHPGTSVVLSLGPSSGLATQITQGAPADVFAAASQATMARVVDAGLAADPTTFATNRMQLVVPAANPARVRGLADLARPGVKLALCQPAVPCGVTAQQVLTAAGVTVTPVTQESDVKAVLAKVRLGEVDAGLVYVTDVRATDDEVRGIEVPTDVNASTAYPIAALKSAQNLPTATAFVDLVLSSTGREVLATAGFGAP